MLGPMRQEVHFRPMKPGEPVSSDVQNTARGYIEAIIKVLRNLGTEFEPTPNRIIDLSETELYRADLSELKLSNASLNKPIWNERTFRGRS